jgi:site-specific DNA recombinase
MRLQVNETEAPIVKRIFQMSASGYSLKAIAKALNAERVPPPRPRRGEQRVAWCPSAIREMLRRELYIDRVVWNRARFIKKPGSRKRIRRERPASEWRVMQHPELSILSDELWQVVQDRLKWAGETCGRRGAVLLGRGVHHLLTGFLKCAECGHNLAIVSGSRKGGHPRYGCPQNSEPGACSNDLREREDWLEERLLTELQGEVLRPEIVDFAVEEFGLQLKARLSMLS